MKIAEIKPRTGNVEVEGVIIDVSPARLFNKFGKEGRVANARLQDDSGMVTVSLWNEQVDQVKVGDKVKITNGWAGEWQGEIQLSTGKFGKLEITPPKGGEVLSTSTTPGPLTRTAPKPASEAGKYETPSSAPKPLGPDDVADEEEFTEEFIGDD